MQNEELINQLQSLIESTQYLKQGSVLSFDNNQVQVRLSNFTTITTKNLGVTKLGDCLVVIAEDGTYAIQESRENNKDTINIINRRVNRTDTSKKEINPEVSYLVCQIDEGSLVSQSPSKFIRIDLEVSGITNFNFEPEYVVEEGPFKRRYCVETIDPISLDDVPSNNIFNTLTECLINDPTSDENSGTSDNPQSDFIPGSLGTVTLNFFASFDEQDYLDYVTEYNLEEDFPNLSPYSCAKQFHFGVPFGGGEPVISYLSDIVTNSETMFDYAKHWVKTYWTTSQLESIYSSGVNTAIQYHLRDWVTPDENNLGNIWINWPFEFAYRHANMGPFTVRSWGGMQINCQENRADTLVAFMQSNGWVLDTFNCDSRSGGSGGLADPSDPPETAPPTEKEASHHIPLSSNYVVNFYLCNSNKSKAIKLHEMAVDDYFFCYNQYDYQTLRDIFRRELFYSTYIFNINSEGRDLYIVEPLLKYFNNQYKGLTDMLFDSLQNVNYFSFNKLDDSTRLHNDIVNPYLSFHNLRTTFDSPNYSHFTTMAFTTNKHSATPSINHPRLNQTLIRTGRIYTEDYNKLKVFYKSKKEILILINEGLVSKNINEYEYFKTHLIEIKNWKIVNKTTQTYPNISETDIQEKVDEYNLNTLLDDYYSYKKTLYKVVETNLYSPLFSLYNSTNSEGLPNFYDLTTNLLFVTKKSQFYKIYQTEDVIDCFYDGKTLTRLLKSYKIENELPGYSVNKGAYYNVYETDALESFLKENLYRKEVFDINEMLFNFFFKNKTELDLVFRLSQPLYNTVDKDKPYILSYHPSTTLEEFYEMRPPIFLNENNKKKDVKVVFKRPTNIPKTTQLQKRTSRILSLQLIP